MPDLGINYRLDIEVLTPLHIGSGTVLRQGFDFMIAQGRTYRLNEDIILSDRWPEDPAQQAMFLRQPPAHLLEKDDLHAHPEYFRYVLDGEPSLHEIREAIKTAEDHPYLPGSSLKGALRTALLRALTEERDFHRGDFGRAGNNRDAKRAGQPLERDLLGRDPLRDVLRAVQVGDSSQLSKSALELTKVQMVPGLDVDVEAIPRGACLTAPLRIDTWLLEQRGKRGLKWTDNLVHHIAQLGHAAQITGKRRIRDEMIYHVEQKEVAPATFYGKLLDKIQSQSWHLNTFVIQVGFAAGWRAKTIIGGMDNNNPLLEQLVKEFHLDRGGGKESRGYKRGEPFPKVRHLAYVSNNPSLPLGWLKVQIVRI
jgi:CRISPR-associated protein Csm5